MDIKITCPSCNQHISAPAAMCGRSITCPSCGEPLKVPTRGSPTAGPSGVGKKILIGIAVIYTIAAVWVTAAVFIRVHDQVRALEAKMRRGRAMPVANNNRPAPRQFSFTTNELWVKPLNGDLAGVKDILDKNPQRLEERIGGMRATMLHVAAYGGQPDVVAELLRRGADVNARTSQGHTPLYDCILGKGTAEIAGMLLEQKADYTIADTTGKTPLQLATERGKQDIADLLRRHGAAR